MVSSGYTSRPKSANPRYDKWFKFEEGADTEGSSSGGLRCDDSFGSSKVLWAQEGQGLGYDMVDRPKTSNPAMERSSEAVAEDVPKPPAIPGRRTSEVLWAAEGGGVEAVRPRTSNPKRDCLSDALHPQLEPQATDACNGILWSSDSDPSISATLQVRPQTTNKQLVPHSVKSPVASPSFGKESEVLWSSEDVASSANGWYSPRPATAPARRTMDLGPTEPLAASARTYRISYGAACDTQLRSVFETLSPDARGYILKQNFCRFYSSLEHFGAPHNAAQVCRRFCCSGPDTLTFEEFCIIMLQWSSR